MSCQRKGLFRLTFLLLFGILIADIEFNYLNLFALLPYSVSNIIRISFEPYKLAETIQNNFPNNPICKSIPVLNWTDYTNYNQSREEKRNDLIFNSIDSYPSDELMNSLLNNIRPTYKDFGLKLKNNGKLTLGDIEDIRGLRINIDVCFINNGIIDEFGRMCIISNESAYKAVCLARSDCTYSLFEKSRMYYFRRYPHYDKVLIISEYWGEGFFHFFLENLPRLVGVLDLIQKDESIKIHVAAKNSMTQKILSSFGINPNRLVHHIVTASQIIFPEPILCGSPTIVHVLALRKLIFKFMDECNIPIQKTKEKRITIINRKGVDRELINHNDLIKALEKEFNPKNYEIIDFKPSKMKKCGIMYDLGIFKNSDVVIAPHGAGLSNMIACKPNTIVIEIQTKEFNFCYLSLALKLNLQYAYFLDKYANQTSFITADIENIVGYLKQKLK